MELERMREFVTFAKFLNVTKASRELLMTQSNLSKHIRKMEQEIGFSTTDRSGTITTLTYEGEQFLNCCINMLSLYDETIEKCKEHQKARRGGLVIQEPSYSDETGLAFYKLLELIKIESPDIPLRFFRPYRKLLTDELKDSKIDLFIAYTSMIDVRNVCGLVQEDGIATLLAEDSLIVWCGESCSLAKLENVSMRDLASVRVLTPNDTYSPIRSILDEYANDYGVSLKYETVESDRSSMFLTIRRPGSVFVLPSSVQSDVRCRACGGMVFRPLEAGRLAFSSHAVMRRETLKTFSELSGLFTGLQGGK